MADHRLITMDELKAKKRHTAWIGNQEVMALLTPQGVRVYSAMCPHQGGPLGTGEFNGDSVTCPWHGCSFNLDAGICTDVGTCRNVSGMKLNPIPFVIDAHSNVIVTL